MALDGRDLRHRRPGAALGLCLLISVWALPSEARDLRPADHGVEHEKDPGAASPAMLAFFGGRPEAALPEASDATDAVLGALGRATPARSDGGERARVPLIAAGVICGVVGAALLAAAGLAYVVRNRRSGPGARTGPVLSLVRWRSGPEVRLGVA